MSRGIPNPFSVDPHDWEALERLQAEGGVDLDFNETQLQAAAYFRQGYLQQMRGDLQAADRSYRKSIELYPTAEAYTFLGWTYSFMGRLADAIAFCKRAIETDPDFGNPYNDIGAYLIELEQFDAAIPYLRQACGAARYDAPHYPHFNLGRALESLGEWPEAMKEYQRALDLYPDYKLAHRHLVQLQAKMN